MNLSFINGSSLLSIDLIGLLLGEENNDQSFIVRDRLVEKFISQGLFHRMLFLLQPFRSNDIQNSVSKVNRVLFILVRISQLPNSERASRFLPVLYDILSCGSLTLASSECQKCKYFIRI
jgi:hypothetical protein